MGTTIDSLQIEISSSATSAKSSLDALTNSLSKLKKATSSGAGLSSFAEKLKSLSSGASMITSSTVSTLDRLADSLSKYSALGNVKFPAKLGESIKSFASSVNGLNIKTDSLRLLGQSLQEFKGLNDVKLNKNLAEQISAISTALAGIDDDKVVNAGLLATYLQEFGSLQGITIPSSWGKGLSSLAVGLRELEGNTYGNLYQLANQLSYFRNIQDIRISSTLGNNILNIAIAAEQLGTVDVTSLSNLAVALQPLSQLGNMGNLRSVLTQLERLPNIFNNLDNETLENFTSRVQQLSAALAPLAQNISAIGEGFSRLPARIQQVASAMERQSTATQSTRRSSTDLLASITLLYASLTKTYDKLTDAITLSNKYVETINLFTASLGAYAEQAQKYAETVSDAVGIDPADWMEAQGIFYNLADGFGIASDRAYTMSQQLTQLSYDLASFYNLSVEDAMLKIRGGLSGEIEMMRQLGVDLSAAAMQERATALGIQEKVTAMSQAEKAQLRYLIMMERTTTAQTDMARTLSAPANQLRVLQAQVTQAARAIGNIFIPILNSVLPVAIAAAKAIRLVAAAIASLFGYSLPEVSYSTGLSDVASSAGDLSDNLGSAGGNAKKLKNALMGFDEINRLPDDSSGGGGGGSGGGATLDAFNWELPTYNFLEGLVTGKADEIYKEFEPVVTWITNNLESILAFSEGIGAALLGWKIATSFFPDLSTSLSGLQTIKGLAAAGLVIGLEMAISYKLGSKYLETGNASYLGGDLINTAINSLLAGKIIGKTFSTTQGAGYYGAAIALSLSAVATIRAIYKGIEVNNGQNSFSLENIAASLWATIKGGAAGALIAKGVGASIVAGGAIGAAIALTVTAGVIITKTIIEQSNLSKAVMWGQMALTASEIAEVAESLLGGIDVVSTVNILDTKIENSEAAQEQLTEVVTNFNALINPVTIGAKISEEDLTTLRSMLDPTSTDGLIQSLQSKLDASTLLIKTTIDLSPATNSEGADQSNPLSNSLFSIDDTIMAAARSCGAQLSALIGEGYEQGLNAQVDEQVVNLTSWLNQIVNGAQDAQTVAKFKLTTSELLESIDRESFVGVVSEYNTQMESLEQALTEAQEQSKLEYATKIEQLRSIEEYYRENGMGELAENVAQQIAEAEEVLANWDVAASVDKAMQEYTAEGKQKLIEAFRNIFSDDVERRIEEIRLGWSGVTPGFSFYAPSTGKIEMFTDEEVQTTADEFATMFDNALAVAYSKEDLQAMHQLADTMGMSIYNLLPTELQSEFISYMSTIMDADKIFPVLQQMGVELTPEVLQIFKDLGIEIPDSLKEGMEEGQTTVIDSTTNLVNTVSKLFGSNNIKSAISKFWSKVKSGTGEKSTSATVTLNFKKGDGSEIIPKSQGVEYTINLKKTWSGSLPNWISSVWEKNFKVNLKKGDTLKWTGNMVDLAGKVTKSFDFSLKKNGGYVKNGEMFIANEAGAEMVGRIGHKSAVANESQIGDAIFKYMDAHSEGDGVNEESLARAIVSGLKQAGIGSVYLNGRDMANAINAETKRTGKSAIVF